MGKRKFQVLKEKMLKLNAAYSKKVPAEGEYTSLGGIMYEGTDREIVIQESVYSRKGAERLLKFAFDLAQSRAKKHVTLATKSNGIAISMPWWDQRADAVYRGIQPLTGDDIGDVAFYAASAPKHVQIAEVLVLATHQASGSHIHRTL